MKHSMFCEEEPDFQAGEDEQRHFWFFYALASDKLQSELYPSFWSELRWTDFLKYYARRKMVML